MSRFLSLAAAVEMTVRDGDAVAMEGFLKLLPDLAIRPLRPKSWAMTASYFHPGETPHTFVRWLGGLRTPYARTAPAQGKSV